MGPDHEADHADRDHGIGHAQITEHRLARESRDNVADHTKGRQDQDVNLRMAKKPEQMLIEQRIAPARRIIKGGAEITVRQQHGDSAGQNRQGQQQQEGGDQHRPNKQRHFVQGHARRPHVKNGSNEVDSAQDRRGTGQMQGQNTHVHRRSLMARGGERCIDRPASTDTVAARRALKKHRTGQQQDRGG